jgi:hypothetical protein
MPRPRDKAPLTNVRPGDGQVSFLTWSNKNEFKLAANTYYNSLESVEAIQHSKAYTNFRDIDTNTSVRRGFTRDHYDYFRPAESIPKKYKEMQSMCIGACEKVGLINNVVTLMSDFVTQGVDVAHPNPKIEKYFKKWWKKVGGKYVTERMANSLHQSGTAIVKRTTAKINGKAGDNLEFANAEPDIEVGKEQVPLKNEIPVKYTLLNPLTVELVSEELSIFVGKAYYAIKLSHKLKQKITNPSNAIEKELVSKLPPDIIAAAKNQDGLLLLNPDKLKVLHYKKNDWQAWANPMIYPILDDIILLEKMKLADMAALDGAISTVRLWKLGSLDPKMPLLPGPAAMTKLADMLLNNVGGGSFDLIWGPDIELIESSSQVYRFLGAAKYEPVLNQIYAGLGIPPTLTGSATSSGFTNNFISIKTLVERLEYVRSIIADFWANELELIRKAKGWRFPAYIRFDKTTLSDEASMKALVLQLVDRDILSTETALERFGEIPELERIRIKREHKSREALQMSKKAGPYHNPQQDHDYKKIFAQAGDVTPGELGLELEEREEGRKTVLEQQGELAEKTAKLKMVGRPAATKPVGKSGQGRPKGKKDGAKRATKTVKPRTSASTKDFIITNIWANEAQKFIAEVITPGYLSAISKTNLRTLTKAESEKLENLKFGVLYNIDPFSDISVDSINQQLKANKVKIDTTAKTLYKNLLRTVAKKSSADITIETERQAQSYVYTLMKGI